MAEEIEIAEYDRRWPARFAAEAEQIRRLLGAPFLEIEHHGSTAVPGLAAKSVIDMLVAVDSIASAERYATTLVQNGYEPVDPRYREIWPERIVLIRRARGHACATFTSWSVGTLPGHVSSRSATIFGPIPTLLANTPTSSGLWPRPWAMTATPT